MLISSIEFSANKVDNSEQLKNAVQAALAGDWEQSHKIAQDYSDDVTICNTANWLHAVLHKIEGDRFNSDYWYAKTSGKKFEDFSDSTQELTTILQCLTKL